MRTAVKLLAIGLAMGTAASIAPSALAQPNVRDHRKEPPPPPPPGQGSAVVRDHRDHDDHHDDGHKMPPPNDHHPHVAPPAPREEKIETKAGFVWAKGRWDWKADKWEWIPGHWEREKAGQQWHDAHWDAQGDTWVLVEGSWGAAGAVPPGPPPGGNTGIVPPGVGGNPPIVRDHRRDWKVERPTVSSYWPAKGKAGAKIVIRGENFPANAQVMWQGTAVAGAKVEGNKIIVPAQAASGMISLHAGHGNDIVVGNFEVAADFDAAAVAKAAADAARAKAEADWLAIQKAQAADKAARQAAAEKRWQDDAASREDRRQKRADELRAQFDAAFLGDPATQDELTLHAQRVAELTRAKDVASVKGDGKLVVRIGVATDAENTRHDQRMADLKAAFAGGKK